MSVRAELEDLVKWIGELTAKNAPPPPPEPLPREDWQAVDRDLMRASKKFADVQAALRARDPGSVLAEFAGDLERQAEGLAFRAHLLSRRASAEKREPAKGEPPNHEPPNHERPAAEHGEDAPPAPGPAKAAAVPGPGRSANATAPASEAAKGLQPGAADLAKSAGDTLETARNNLVVVAHPDDVAKDFEEELDVLAEMTLSLRQQCEQLDAGRPAARAGR